MPMMASPRHTLARSTFFVTETISASGGDRKSRGKEAVIATTKVTMTETMTCAEAGMDF